jgi:hypothetical protein
MEIRIVVAREGERGETRLVDRNPQFLGKLADQALFADKIYSDPVFSFFTGSKTTSRTKGSCRNLGYPASGRHLITPAVRIGKVRSRSR